MAYYLHQLDGTRAHRSTIIMITQDANPPVVLHDVGGSPLINSEGKPEAYDNGWMMGPLATENAALKSAVALAQSYNWIVWHDGQQLDVPRPALGLGDVMTTSEAAAEFRVDDSTVRQAVRRGSIPARQSGSTWLVRREDAQARWG